MKKFFITGMIVLMITSCRKESSTSQDLQEIAKTKLTCTPVTIIYQDMDCDRWAVTINGIAYPVLSLPDAFRKSGMEACISYELVQDLRDCLEPCCGGIWVSLLSIEARKK